MVQLAYGHDVVQRVTECMLELDPSFKVPHNFFKKVE
jgi:hypothetical protein